MCVLGEDLPLMQVEISGDKSRGDPRLAGLAENIPVPSLWVISVHQPQATRFFPFEPLNLSYHSLLA